MYWNQYKQKLQKYVSNLTQKSAHAYIDSTDGASIVIF